MPGSKCRLTDAGLEAALILRGPGPGGGFRGGRIDDRPTDHLDVAPTLLEAAGTSAAWHAGRSLAAPPLPGRLRFSEINHHNAHQPERSVRGPRFRLTRRWPTPADDAGRFLGNTDLTPARRGFDALDPPPLRLRAVAEPVEELFDAAADPLHAHDLAADPAFAADRQRLASALDRWMAETGDPLLAASP